MIERKDLLKMKKAELINHIDEFNKAYFQVKEGYEKKIKGLKTHLENLETSRKTQKLLIGDTIEIGLNKEVFILCKDKRTYRGIITQENKIWVKIQVKDDKENAWEYFFKKDEIVSGKIYNEYMEEKSTFI